MAKTIRVRAVVGILGLRPGQIADVDHTKQVRALLGRGLVEEVVTETAAPVPAEPAPEG
jgi:hypothetical protein